jgi:oxidase EvaA
LIELSPDPEGKEESFLRSALTLDNPFQSLDEVRAWLKQRQDSDRHRVEEVPLARLDGWTFEAGSGDLVHASGRFFRIEGLRVRTTYPHGPRAWEQPIINQPEIGILGMLTRVVDGTRYFLVQAKFEPGNVNLVQLSPTLQATCSNFTRVHRGKQPRYLDWFTRRDAHILVDQLQSEQGARFLRKRNRNMIVEVSEDLEPHQDFRWLTLGELKLLLASDDLVNMDARTVLSCIPLVGPGFLSACRGVDAADLNGARVWEHALTGFAGELLGSLACTRGRATSSDDVISWFTHLKTLYELDVRYLPLSSVQGWRHSEGAIRHEAANYFSVVGIDVRASDREVPAWSQPILRHDGLGLVGYLAGRLDGVLHFLVGAKVEPGIFDVVEMGPTVSLFDLDRRRLQPEQVPFLEHFLDPPAERVRFDSVLSEEGGRLLRLRNRYMVVEVSPRELPPLPENFVWMTLGQMMGFVRYNNYFNIEARGLLAALRLEVLSVRVVDK